MAFRRIKYSILVMLYSIGRPFVMIEYHTTTSLHKPLHWTRLWELKYHWLIDKSRGSEETWESRLNYYINDYERKLELAVKKIREDRRKINKVVVR